IGKADEAAILSALGQAQASETRGALTEAPEAAQAYVGRYADAFGPDALQGLRIGVYEHSSVARDLLHDVLRACGAESVPLARSDTFIPVDTEAVGEQTRAMLAGWAKDHGLHAIVSTDGDADRPMLTDAHGRVIPGDVLGALSAVFLGADTLCTPVSSNTMIDQMPQFAVIHRTRIGSPYVIAAMEEVLAANPKARVIGYEANGGTLLGYTAEAGAGPLAPLMTRDCLLPILAPLALTCAQGIGVAELVATLPPRFTAADRVTDVEPEKSRALIDRLASDASARAAFFETGSSEAAVDVTDGLRVRFADGSIVHLRPSGNAPECRCYTEADSAERAQALLALHMKKLAAMV
ncbi:unnamed protein product, partial [Cyprideis torosa]